jgi:hypothetical protein
MALTVDEEQTFLRLVDQHRGIVGKVAAGYASTAADRHDLSQEIPPGLRHHVHRLRRTRPLPDSGRCGRALRKSWIGSTVNRAQAVLDEIEEFEREAG